MKRLAVSPLTGRINMGRVNKAGTAFLADKVDFTSEVMKAVVEKAEFHGGEFDIVGGSRRWTVTVKEVKS